MPPITLTKSQFLAKRPGGVYQNYLSYINAHRQAPDVRGPATPLDPISTLMAQYRTDTASLGKSSAQAVADSIAAQKAGIDADYRAQQDALAKQQERAHGFALALGDLTKGDPAAIAAQYREGANRLNAYGTGLTGAVADAEQQNLAKARAAVEGLLGPGAGADVKGYDPAAMQNAAQLAGVTLPGQSLEKQALDEYVRANYNRAASVAGIENISTGYGQKINDIVAEIAAKKAALEGQRPALVRQELASETGQARQNLATMLSAIGLMGTQAQQAWARNYQKQQLNIAKGKAKATNTPTFDATNSRAKGYEVDQFGKPIGGVITPLPGYKLNKAGTGVVKIPTGSKGSGAPTHLQQKTTKGGTVYLFDPVTGNSYLPGDTKNPIDPNTLKGKAKLAPDKIREFRARATKGLAVDLGAKLLPSEIYKNAVAGGIPGWIEAQILRKEAANHPNEKAWQNVLKPGWVAGG